MIVNSSVGWVLTQPTDYTEANDLKNKYPSLGTYEFSDGPRRGYPSPPPEKYAGLNWSASLFLASSNGDGSITVYDGIGWGFKIQSFGSTNVSGAGSGVDKSPAPAALPEPSSLILCLSGLVAFSLHVVWPRIKRAASLRVIVSLLVVIGAGATFPCPCFSAGDAEDSRKGPRDYSLLLSSVGWVTTQPTDYRLHGGK